MDRHVLKVGFLSRWYFFWLDCTLRKNYNKEIGSKDLYPVPEDESSSHLCDRLETEWKKEIQKQFLGKKPDYHLALLRCFKWQIVISAGLTVLKDAARMTQPFLLARILQYFDTKDVAEDGDRISTMDAYLFALGLAIATMAVPMLHHPIFHIYTIVGIRMRIASSALIYRKVLRLSSKSLFVTTTGHVVNLISNDVAKLENVMQSWDYLWWGPLQTVLILIILWNKIGSTSLVGLTLSVLLSAALLATGKILQRLRLKAAAQSDERIRLMDQIVSGIKVIKMYCWEKSFARLVETVRTREMSVISTSNAIRYTASEFGTCSFSIFATALCIISYVLMNGAMMPLETILTVKWLLYLVEEALCYYFGDAVTFLSMALATCKRIQEFMLLSDVERTAVDHSLSKDDCNVVLHCFSGSWKTDSDDMTLHDISLQAKPMDLLAVIGTVGSGKSSLLMAILGELPPSSGTVSTRGRIAYVAQQPWIFSASVKDNILFGSTFDETKYKAVIEACVLSKDFELLPQGDETPVGERGVILSGGQRTRIGLARAVYRDADIYLLDDPLSAVDSVVAEHLFNRCINGLIKHRIRIMVTHHLRFIQSATQIVWLVNGNVKTSGCYSEIRSYGFTLDEQRVSAPPDASQSLTSTLKSGIRVPVRSKSVPALTTSGSGDWTAEGLGLRCTWSSICHSESPASNTIVGDALGHDVKVFRVSPAVQSCITNSLDASKMEERDNDVTAKAPLLATEAEHTTNAMDSGTAIEPELVQSGAVSLHCYWQYFRSGGNALELIVVAFVVAAAQAGFIVFDWYVTAWAYTEDKHRLSAGESHRVWNSSDIITTSHQLFNVITNVTNQVVLFGNKSLRGESYESGYDSAERVTRTWVFGALSAAVVGFSFLRAFASCKLCARASTIIHSRMFESLVKTRMRFFDTNPAGRILNRFSRDVGTVDDELSFSFYEFFTVTAKVIAIILLSIAANPWTIAPLLPLIAALLFVLRMYTPYSRAVKRLEGVARSPVFSHLSTTLVGLQSVRAYGEQDALIRQFDAYQDSHTEAYYMHTAMSRWLGIRLDWICSFFISCVIFLFLAARESLKANPSLFGLTINNVLLLTAVFQVAIRYLGVIEIYMTSVERCADYIELKPEESSSASVRPPQGWPNHGVIEAHGVSLRYADNEPDVLKNISFRIDAAQKIGICGRTGAGKSSLISMLFRLCEPKGRVLIDGVCISDIALKDLRSAISIIPQDPVLFSTTVRGNLDPFSEHNDSDLWRALDQVQLAATVRDLDGGLEARVSEGGLNFSTGQRQLVCLARALLRRNKILVIDEATANVDLATDAAVQKTIRMEFKDCTVLTIAHRLDTIMDSDRVMVLENGIICEFDEPQLLLQRQESAFYSLVQHSGRVHEHTYHL